MTVAPMNKPVINWQRMQFNSLHQLKNNQLLLKAEIFAISSVMQILVCTTQLAVCHMSNTAANDKPQTKYLAKDNR